MSLIELEQVSRHYASGGMRVIALDNVSLRIKSGEMVAIMGASGSGKSTLMNLLGCLDRPSSGQLRVDGSDLANLSPDEMAALRRETFGFIFQRYHLLPHLDAVANVELPGIYSGFPSSQRRERAIALLQRLGLGDRLTHKPNALSGGQQQRVSIARALMNGGRIILADEPTGALDSASGAELLALLVELNAMGHTVILVTHDLDVAAHAGRIIELRDGRIVRDEPSSPARTRISLGRDAHMRPATSGTIHSFVSWRAALLMGLAALNGNRMRSALSILGICIGIAAVTSIMALSDAASSAVQRSARDATASRLNITQGNHNLPPGAVAQPLTVRDMAALRTLPGVTAIVPDYAGQAGARHGKFDTSVMVNGVSVHDIDRNLQIIKEGRDISEIDLDTRAQVAVLDRVACEDLFAPGEPILGRQVIVGELPFTVIGIAAPRLELDSTYEGFMPPIRAMGKVYVPQRTYTTKFDTRGNLNTFSIHFATPVPTEAFQAQIRQRLLALHSGIEDFTIASHDLLMATVFSPLITHLKWLFAGIAAISLLVGGVGVMNIMLVSVAERTREIGIRMAVGARQSDVRRQFLIESVFLCCVGGAAGLALPWLGSLANLPLLISFRSIVIALGSCTFIGLLFGNLPANRAATLSPVDALARD